MLQLLSLTTPRFPTFFTWIMVLLTAIAVAVPLSLPVAWENKLATAVINLAIGIAIMSILNGVARSAWRRPPGHAGPDGEPRYGETGPAGAPGPPPPWQST
jgi:hypothetical protein